MLKEPTGDRAEHFMLSADPRASTERINYDSGLDLIQFAEQNYTALRETITRQKLRAIDGYLPIPREPGLGIDLARYQWFSR